MHRCDYSSDMGSRRFRAALQEKMLLFENLLSLVNLGVSVFYDGGMVWGGVPSNRAS